MRRQIASIDLAIGPNGTLYGPAQVETEGEVRPGHGAEPLHHLVLSEVDVELGRSPDLTDDLDCGDEGFVCHHSALLLQTLIALDVVTLRLDVWQLPSHHVLVPVRLVRPSVPPERALMHNLCDLVQEVSEISLEHICVVDELVNLADHEDGIQLLARDHNLQVAIA